MSYNNTVDNIAAGVLGIILLAVLVIIFPLAPGAVVGWEVGKYFGMNQDVLVMISIVGAVVNFGFYQLLFTLLKFSSSFFKKLMLYAIATVSMLCIDLFIENEALHVFSDLFFKTLFFFADFTRWFTDSAFLNGFLFVLYVFVIFKMYFLIVKQIHKIYYKNRRRFY